MAEAFQACRAASQSISATSNGGQGSQEAVDACSSLRRAIRRRHSAADEGRGGRVVARHIQRMSEKHPDFEIEPVNTIQPPEIEYTQTPQALVPIDTPLSIICKHIPRQSDIDKIVKNIETCVIHSLELPVQAQNLVKVYQTSTHFLDIYQYITDGKLPSSSKAQNCIRAEALNYVVINNFLFRIDMQKDRHRQRQLIFVGNSRKV